MRAIARVGEMAVPRRPAQIVQADAARVIRAAKQAGAAEVEVKVGDHVFIVRFAPSTERYPPLAQPEEIVL